MSYVFHDLVHIILAYLDVLSLNVEDILSEHEALEEIDMAPEQQHSHSTCISIQEAILPILE